jgi:hypothetical protein
MCQVSDKLKLCSCETKDVERLKHFWVLKRHNGENICIVGIAILPAVIGKKANKLNEEVLCKMLNEGNCFDIELKHQQNDILELHFTVTPDPEISSQFPSDEDFLTYVFTFNKKRWKKTDFDPFAANLKEVQKGKIVDPFAKIK